MKGRYRPGYNKHIGWLVVDKHKNETVARATSRQIAEHVCRTLNKERARIKEEMVQENGY